MENRSRGARDYFLIALFGIFSFAMLMQSYNLFLSTRMYFLVVVLFILAVSVSILFSKEIVALVGIFLFSIVVRLMYYVSTGFTVLAYGDPYSQYSVLQYFAETSHVSVFPSTIFLNFLTRIPHQYSQWPGFEAYALSFSRISNLPLYWTALAIPFILYTVWFVISYVLVKKLFSRFSNLPGSGSVLPVLAIAIATTILAFELPPIFKYDFMAAVLLTAFILLLTYPFERQVLQKSLLLVLLAGSIVVTHSLTSLFMMIIIALVGVSFVVRALITELSNFRHSIYSRYSISLRNFQEHVPFPKLIFFVVALTAVWWTYYATYAEFYGGKTTGYIFNSFSLTNFFTGTAVGKGKAPVLSSLTYSWLLPILHYRDDLLLVLVAIGAIMIVIRPSFLGNRAVNTVILLSIGVVTLVTEVFKSLNFGDRAFLTFAPILACFMIVPIAVIAVRKLRIAKLIGILLLIFFMFTLAVGFWGSSYAPVFLYSNSASAYAFGEHPTNWQSVASYVNYAPSGANPVSPTCVLTNEIYATSLVVPVSELSSTFIFTDIRPRPGCIAIIYDELLHFNSSYIGQSYSPYQATPTLPAYSNAAFQNTLSNQSDLVFDGGNSTVYYLP